MGMTFGAFVWMILLPEWIQRWEWGADGERATARELARLTGYDVTHDITLDRSNIDHLIVGPQGVFLLDSKNLGGWAAVSEDKPGMITVQRGETDTYERNIGSGVQRVAGYASSQLTAATRIKVWVEPVIVMWNPFPQKAITIDGTHFISGDNLVEWLEHRPTKYAPEHITRIARGFEAGLSS